MDGAVDDDVETVRRALVTAIEDVDADVLAAKLQNLSRGTSRAAPIGPLAQFRAAERLEDRSIVALREHLAATLDRQADQRAVLRGRIQDLPVASDDLPGVDALLTRGSMTAGELGLDLARRLVLAGVAVVTGDDRPE